MIRGSTFSAILHGLLLALLLFGLPHVMLLIEGEPTSEPRAPEPQQIEVATITPEQAKEIDKAAARPLEDIAKSESGKQQGLVADAVNTETDQQSSNKLQSAAGSNAVIQAPDNATDGLSDTPDQNGQARATESTAAVSPSAAAPNTLQAAPSQRQTPSEARTASAAATPQTSREAVSETVPPNADPSPAIEATTARDAATRSVEPLEAGAPSAAATNSATEGASAPTQPLAAQTPGAAQEAAAQQSPAQASRAAQQAAEPSSASVTASPSSGAAALAAGDAASRTVQPLVAALPRLDETVGEIFAAERRTAAEAAKAAQSFPALQQTISRMSLAADQGYAHAQFALAEILLTGDGQPRDVEKGLQYLKRASLNGYAPAQLLTAVLATEGSILERDLAEAHAWLEAAAERGSQQAQEALPRLEQQMTPRETVRARQRRSQLRQVFVLSSPQSDKNARQPREEQLRVATTLGDVEAVYVLLSQGADANKPDGEGRTAAIEAAWRGYGKILNALLDQGADARSTDESGKTALMWAAINGHAEVAQRLIDAEIPVNAQDREGMTALMRAAWNGHVQVVDLLLKNRASTAVRDRSGKTALDYAAQSGRTEIVRLLQAPRR